MFKKNEIYYNLRIYKQDAIYELIERFSSIDEIKSYIVDNF